MFTTLLHLKPWWEHSAHSGSPSFPRYCSARGCSLFCCYMLRSPGSLPLKENKSVYKKQTALHKLQLRAANCMFFQHRDAYFPTVKGSVNSSHGTAPGACGYEIMSLGTRKHQTVPHVLQIQLCDDYLMITIRVPAVMILLIIYPSEVFHLGSHCSEPEQSAVFGIRSTE